MMAHPHMKRSITAVIAVSIMLALCAVAFASFSQNMSATTTQRANIRKSPNGVSLGILSEGTEVEILSKTIAPNGGVWYYVKVNQHLSGYMHESVLTEPKYPASYATEYISKYRNRTYNPPYTYMPTATARIARTAEPMLPNSTGLPWSRNISSATTFGQANTITANPTFRTVATNATAPVAITQPADTTMQKRKNVVLGSTYTILGLITLVIWGLLATKGMLLRKKNIELQVLEQGIQRIYNENLQCAPWLAGMYADFMFMKDSNTARYLETKSHPAYSTAAKIREISKEKRQLTREYKALLYKYEIYTGLFPWLEDYDDANANAVVAYMTAMSDDAKSEYDALRNWLSTEEYTQLTTAEKYQLALDRYWGSSKKSNWQIGIDYERYIGYLYEQEGFVVEYVGATKGLEDMGRDLIASNERCVFIIQCKYWNTHKTIHEKHLFQLYGTCVSYKINNRSEKRNVTPVLITTTSLSDMANQVSKELSIKIRQQFPFSKNYPCIKCNINQTSGEKIYHLPFDQMYDKVRIKYAGERYVTTVAEAERLGFRRAKKWYGDAGG